MSAEFSTTEGYIRQSFADFMNAAMPGMPVIQDNEHVDPPDLATILTNADRDDEAWVRLVIQWGGSELAEIAPSTKRYRTVGTVISQVFTPKNRGSGLASRIANQIVTHWRLANIEGVTFRAPYPNRVGVDDAGWFQVNVTAPMFLDAVPS